MTDKLFPVWIDDATFRSLMALRGPDGERLYRWGIVPKERADKPANRSKRAGKKRA